MHRLDEKTIAIEIEMAAWRAFNRFEKGLHSKVTRGHAQRDIIAELQRAFINDHTCIVVTGQCGFSHGLRRGKFGEDEPWPAPLEVERHAR